MKPDKSGQAQFLAWLHHQMQGRRLGPPRPGMRLVARWKVQHQGKPHPGRRQDRWRKGKLPEVPEPEMPGPGMPGPERRDRGKLHPGNPHLGRC